MKLQAASLPLRCRDLPATTWQLLPHPKQKMKAQSPADSWWSCRAITVSYAFKKDAKGERHGTPNERLLADQNRARTASQNRPNTLFATGVPAAKPLFE